MGHYDSEGRLIAAWAHTDKKGCWSSNLAVVGEKIVLVDKAGHSIRIYSMDGKVIKIIGCPEVTGRWVSICKVNEESILLSVHETSRVIRINIASWEVVWRSDNIEKAQGVVCYKDKYVLVAREGTGTVISVLDINSGEHDMTFKGGYSEIGCKMHNDHNLFQSDLVQKAYVHEKSRYWFIQGGKGKA